MKTDAEMQGPLAELAAAIARRAKGNLTDALILAGDLSHDLFEAVRQAVKERKQ